MSLSSATGFRSRLNWSVYLARQMRGQARLPFAPPEAIRQRQARRLRAMVAHAYATVPYYRETMDRLGLTVDDFRAAEDLARLPLIEPDQLQRDPERFTSTAWPPDRCVRLCTGGSTGDPRPVFHTPEAIFQNAAHGERERSIHVRLIGRRFGYRETVIASGQCTGLELQAFTHSRALLPAQLSIKRQYILLTDPPEANLRLINQYRPHVLQSYGSYLAVLFAHLADTGADFHRPKLITYNSDGLSDSVRRLIVERFGISVFTTYQAIEALKIGFECDRHAGVHLNIDLYPLRIVDSRGRDLPPGQPGEVVISNLVNRATVLLNYRLGDLAARLEGPCPCGRSLPMISWPLGRSDDLVRLPSDELLHSDAIRTIFTCEEQLWEWQVIQHSPTAFSVKVVAAESADWPAMKERLAGRFARRFGPEATVDIVRTDTIPRTERGKTRAVISLCAPAPARLVEPDS